MNQTPEFCTAVVDCYRFSISSIPSQRSWFLCAHNTRKSTWISCFVSSTALNALANRSLLASRLWLMPSPHQTHDGTGTNRNRHWAMQHVTPIGVQRPPDATQACTAHAECMRACVSVCMCVLPVACVHALRNDCIISTWAPCGCGLPLAERQSCLGAWVWGLAAGTICWRPSHLTVQDGLSLDRHPFAVKGDHLWLTCLLCFFEQGKMRRQGPNGGPISKYPG